MNDKELERAKHEIRTTINNMHHEHIPCLKDLYKHELFGMWNLLWAMGYHDNYHFMRELYKELF